MAPSKFANTSAANVERNRRRTQQHESESLELLPSEPETLKLSTPARRTVRVLPIDPMMMGSILVRGARRRGINLRDRRNPGISKSVFFQNPLSDPMRDPPTVDISCNPLRFGWICDVRTLTKRA